MSDNKFILKAKVCTNLARITGNWEIAAIVLDSLDMQDASGSVFKEGVSGFRGVIITTSNGYWEDFEYLYISGQELVKLYNDSTHGTRFIYYSESSGDLFPEKLSSYSVVATDGWSALWYPVESYPTYIFRGNGEYALIKEGKTRVLVDSLYYCIQYSSVENYFIYFDSKGVIQSEKRSRADLKWFQQKYLVEGSLCFSLDSEQSEYTKYSLLKTARLSADKQYELAIARNRITQADCGVVSENYAEDGGSCLTEFKSCESGVCKIVSAIDSASLLIPLPSDIQVLDFSDCKYLSIIALVTADVDGKIPKVTIILPKGEGGILWVSELDVDISDYGLPSYGGNTIAFIGGEWIKVKSLFFLDAVLEGISKIQVIGYEETSTPYEEVYWARHPDSICFDSVRGIKNLDIWCDYTKILCGRGVAEASELLCAIRLCRTDTEVLNITGNAPSLKLVVNDCQMLREVSIETSGSVWLADILNMVNENQSLERVSVKAGKIVGEGEIPLIKSAMIKRGVSVMIEANSVEIEGKAFLSFDTGRSNACKLSWEGAIDKA